ncbi:hypothetical protein FNV43_RR08594 [Rhamnella rubrinervis]|uniref:Uncharacterized protein n=1 Tax=Rhamnella rubrinervis TaxID=2594499 RepID=A0A8K0H8I1_9ROSA|nr:hypothetical protein FNV43_RR08594 [Rhamnella rubrinervis]
MVYLFLREPIWNDDRDNVDAKMRISLLNKLEYVIKSFLMSEGRSQAHFWLCDTIAGISSISRQHQCELFMNLLRSKTLRRGLASQLLQMIFEKRPHKAGSIIAKRSHVLEKFFEGKLNPMRISQWFANFEASGGGLEHGKGAKALSQFAFINRDICWEELEWKGKHGQSPAVVATKPHYFLDLDVQRTVENFLENVPEFWSSSEFSESLKDGEILLIDRNFFLEYFVDLMYKKDSRDVWEVITEFLKEESFSYLCRHLFVTLDERDLCRFLGLLCKFVNPGMEPKDFSNSSFLFEVVLSKCKDCGSFDQILLLDAVLSKKRELLNLLRDEDSKEAQAEIKDIVLQISAIPANDNSLASIIKECVETKTIEAIKLLGLESWVLYYRLSEECQTLESWESLFRTNAISFRKSQKYAFVNDKGLSEESDSDLDHGVSSKIKRKRKGRSRKKKKRKFDYDDNYDDEFLDFDTSNDRLGLQSNVGSWLLSTDGYSVSWNIVDLPEHLSKHCLSTWMRWISAMWDA